MKWKHIFLNIHNSIIKGLNQNMDANNLGWFLAHSLHFKKWYMYWESESIGYTHTHRKGQEEGERHFLRNWLMQLWGLTSLKSVGWVGRLEIQVRVDVAVSSLYRVDQARWTLRQFPCYSLQAEFFFFWRPHFFFSLSAFNWLDKVHPHFDR